jgi:hypothetical protein
MVTDLHTRVPSSVGDVPADPAKFIAKQWPLLSQYLDSQPGKFRTRVFAVSARGGGMTPADIARLTAIARPSERISVVDGTHTSNDLSRPVSWLLGLLPADT